MKNRCTVIIPAKNEDSVIIVTLNEIYKVIDFDFECIIVVDDKNDSTIKNIQGFNSKYTNFSILINQQNSGFQNAIKSGINAADSEVIIVTMADGSDDPAQIPLLVKLIEDGASIACASRYMHGGAQIGASFFKSFLSLAAGKSFSILTNCGTKDATNNYKAYKKSFIEKFSIESKFGFEVGLELVAKAVRNRLIIVETPTTWVERSTGVSNFKLAKSIFPYLRWYLYGLGIIRK
jgi:glycosyltransferase involved in cell wall biosynthesis